MRPVLASVDGWIAKVVLRGLTALALASLLWAAPAAGQEPKTFPKSIGPRSVSIFGGWEATDGPIETAFRAVPKAGERSDNFLGGAVSYQFFRFWRDFTADLELGAGIRFPNSGALEGWAAVFFRYHGLPWRDKLIITPAASTGLNYTDRLPYSEIHSTYEGDRPKSKVLHYFAPEIAFALPESPQHELFVRLHHRSGVFGVFGGVHGGADVVTLGYRFRF